jgi:hypothetical protein
VDNRVTFSFDPVLEAEVSIASFTLDKARLTSRADARFEQQLTITATGAADLDVTKTLIAERKFIKVFMAGPVPIVMTGSFAADLSIQGHATGKIQANETLEIRFDNLEYGFEYADGVWKEIKNVEPTFSFKLSGEADAEVHLTFSLQPRLKVTFYEALTGRLLIAPYYTADAGIHGHVYADFVPEGITKDGDYWLSKGRLASGLDAWIFANLAGCKLNICKWPQSADEANYKSYKKIELIANTPILGLPSLTVTQDLGSAHPADSRALRFQGNHSEIPNPFHNLLGIGPKAFITFSQWTAPKVIALNDSGYRFLDPLKAAPGEHWVAFDKPGQYTLRLGGYSNLGGWARQVADISLHLVDADGDGMLDWWEDAYGIEDPLADDDGDGTSNLDEFLAGTCPVCPGHWLQVTTNGPGRVYGTGIDCGTLCTASFDDDVSLLLYAEAEPDASFQGWGGACATAGANPTCLVAIEGNTQVLASFKDEDDDGEDPEAYPLNDTGLDWCANASQNNLACPISGFPGQDAESGPDVTHNDDSDGHAGFSFTKIANSGNALPNSAALGSGANAWGCTRDNVTGLMWEVKTDNGGLRDQDWSYSWYNPDAATNGGSAGYADYGNNCFNTARCDTHKFVADVNAQGLCGASDWRLPNRFELESITRNDRYNPAIDTAFFPNTPSSWFWWSSPYAGDARSAWGVDFYDGDVSSYSKHDAGYVRLVRGGQ